MLHDIEMLFLLLLVNLGLTPASCQRHELINRGNFVSVTIVFLDFNHSPLCTLHNEPHKDNFTNSILTSFIEYIQILTGFNFNLLFILISYLIFFFSFFFFFLVVIFLFLFYKIVPTLLNT